MMMMDSALAFLCWHLGQDACKAKAVSIQTQHQISGLQQDAYIGSVTIYTKPKNTYFEERKGIHSFVSRSISTQIN